MLLNASVVWIAKPHRGRPRKKEKSMSDFLDLSGVMVAVMLPVSLIVFITEYFKYKKSTWSQLGTLRK